MGLSDSILPIVLKNKGLERVKFLAYERRKRWIDKQKQLGLCTSCTQKVVPGFLRCEKHRNKK